MNRIGLIGGQLYSFQFRRSFIGMCGWRRSVLKEVMIGVLWFVSSALANAQSQRSLRPLQPEDIFKLQQAEIPEMPFSPRGDAIAYSLAADVWVYSPEQGTSMKVTDGEKDHARFWGPQWSPKGDKLLILSNKGDEGRIVHLWVWDKCTRHLRQLSDEIWDEYYRPFWVSDTKLVASTWTRDFWAHDRWRGGGSPIAGPLREWKKWEAGQGSYSILSSDTAKNEGATRSPANRLVLLDISNGESRVLLQDDLISLGQAYSPDIASISRSPSNKFFVGYSTERLDLQGFQRQPGFSMSAFRNALKFFTLNGPLEAKGLGGIYSVVPGSVEWVPGKDQIVFNALLTREDARNRRYRVYNLVTDQLQDLDTKDIVPAAGVDAVREYPFAPKVHWDNKNRLVVYGSRGNDPDHRLDWWLIGEDGPVNLTGLLKEPPYGEVRAVTERSSFVMLQRGKLLRIYLDGMIETVAPSIPGKVVTAQYFPDRVASDSAGIRYIVLETDQAPDSNIFQVDLESGTTTAITRPAPGAEFRAYDPATNRAVFDANNRSGSYVWQTDLGSSKSKLVLETNTFLREVAEGEAKQFTYTSLNGELLNGWLLLPLGYQEGKKYPLVTWVYLGQNFGKNSKPFIASDIMEGSSLNLQFWAANGYAVLIPSMPSESKSPFMDLLNGVIPAVQQVIASGVADADRLAVAGHSTGGFSTVGLIAQTKMFKSAIAEAPVIDFLGGYGQLRLPDRYEDNADTYVGYALYHYESELGNPPWIDPESYLRNSPLLYAKRIDTPLLLIHGDMDMAVPMADSEQMYMALRRLGKKTRLIRYWGEGHEVSSPANVKHMWQQIFQWLNETGVPPGGR